MTKKRRSPRYRVKRTGSQEVELHVLEDCWLGFAGYVLRFMCWSHYVHTPFRGGTRQVCERLHHTGSTLMSSPGGLLECIRSEARACLREQAREEDRY